MERDFTFSVYENLCNSLKHNNFKTIGVNDFITKSNSKSKYAIIRHDVDARPQNALRMAKLESNLNISSTYYFRIIKFYCFYIFQNFSTNLQAYIERR